jgi:hypothetical protein
MVCRKILLVLLLTACWCGGRAASEPIDADADVTLVRDAGLSIGGLLDYFQQRTLTSDDEKKIAALVRQLGSDNYRERELATRTLLSRGVAALPFLRAAAQPGAELEVKRRAQTCIAKIEATNQPEVTAAALRLLVQQHGDRAAATLLRFAPFAEQDYVEEQVLTALAGMVDVKKIDPAFLAALEDSKTSRRAAAAFALARLDDITVKKRVQPLLDDKESIVRLRAAEGLLLGRDQRAVPTLIALLGDNDARISSRAEEILYLVAGDKSPAPNLEYADKWREAWHAWWKKNENIDLSKYADRPPFLGLALIPEMHAGKVFECDKKGKPRWSIDGLTLPIDAQSLPGGRVLIAELTGNRVTERDRAGKTLWTHPIKSPIACARLANGQTFIGTNYSLLTVTKDNKETVYYKPEQGYYIHSVQRLANGHSVMVSMAGEVREVDTKGSVIRRVPLANLGGGGNWCGIESVPGNRYLVVRSGQVHEIDYTGKSHWDHALPSACYASRLPNGNTLIVCSERVVEVDRFKKVVWERKTDKSIWRAHMR